uniref:Uncharacterized protein n=1 Tax=Cacopsylla melanoneura TaxID=428564 RepID=A0A8D8WM05_9HEMI
MPATDPFGSSPASVLLFLFFIMIRKPRPTFLRRIVVPELDLVFGPLLRVLGKLLSQPTHGLVQFRVLFTRGPNGFTFSLLQDEIPKFFGATLRSFFAVVDAKVPVAKRHEIVGRLGVRVNFSPIDSGAT